MESGRETFSAKQGGGDRRGTLIKFVAPLLVAVVLFSSMFAFALKYHWIDENIDTGPVVPGSMTMILSPDGGSFHMTYNVEGGGLVYATNASGHWVKAQLTTEPVTRTALFIDAKKAVQVAAVNGSGVLLYITNSRGGKSVV